MFTNQNPFTPSFDPNTENPRFPDCRPVRTKAVAKSLRRARLRERPGRRAASPVSFFRRSILLGLSAIFFTAPVAGETDGAKKTGVYNGGFERPTLSGSDTSPFYRLEQKGDTPTGWRVPRAPARVEWLRPADTRGSLPPAPEGEQYAIIRELDSDSPMLFDQMVEVTPRSSGGPSSYELSFRAGRPSGEPMAVSSALIIFLKPGSEVGRSSTGLEIIEPSNEGEFSERHVRFKIPADARQDEFYVRFVVRGADPWANHPNPPGQQRLLLDDVQLRPVYD